MTMFGEGSSTGDRLKVGIPLGFRFLLSHSPQLSLLQDAHHDGVLLALEFRVGLFGSLARSLLVLRQGHDGSLVSVNLNRGDSLVSSLGD